MKVEFEQPVVFSTVNRAFTGPGIPPIPEDSHRLVVSDHAVAFLGQSGEVWECFFGIGIGTTEKSKTYYWPCLSLCPRAWAEALRAHET